MCVGVDPDGERSFAFNRGHCREIRSEDIVSAMLADVGVVHLNAYKLGSAPVREAVLLMVGMARETTGSGDAFAAGFLVAWMRQSDLQDAMSLAHAAAGLCLRQAGGRLGAEAMGYHEASDAPAGIERTRVATGSHRGAAAVATTT